MIAMLTQAHARELRSLAAGNSRDGSIDGQAIFQDLKWMGFLELSWPRQAPVITDTARAWLEQNP